MSRVTVTRVNRSTVLGAMLNEDFLVTGKTSLDLAQNIARAMGTHPSYRGKIHEIVCGLIDSGLIIHRDATVRLATKEEREEAEKVAKRQRAAKHFSRRRRQYDPTLGVASMLEDLTSEKPEPDSLDRWDLHDEYNGMPKEWLEFIDAEPDDPALLRACALVAA